MSRLLHSESVRAYAKRLKRWSSAFVRNHCALRWASCANRFQVV